MKKIVLIDSSYPINTRNARIYQSLVKSSSVFVISWDRNNTSRIKKEDSYILYKDKAEYGNKIQKLKKLHLYYSFVKQKVLEISPDIIIASHWDMLLITLILKKYILENNIEIIYDVLDMPDSNSLILNKIVDLLEKNMIKHVDKTILASRFFEKFYKEQKILIYENYVYKCDDFQIQLNESYYNLTNKNKKIIAFIGVVRYKDILINLINAFKNNNNFIIRIYGDGPSINDLIKFCKNNNISNIDFYGRFEYKNLKYIYSDVDFVWAAYPNKSKNVKYAISNKFYETMYYNKIGIFSCNTELGEFVKDNKIGIVVDPYDLKSIQENIVKCDNIQKIIMNISKYRSQNNIFWEENEMRLIDFITSRNN